MKAPFLLISLLVPVVSSVLWGNVVRETAAQSQESQLQQQIVAKEHEELDSLKTGNMELFSSLLSNNAIFVDAHGSASKAEVVEHTAGFRLTEYTMDDVRFVPVSADSGLITYKITEKGMSHGKEFSVQVYVSALWAKQQGKWVCLFSQETAAK